MNKLPQEQLYTPGIVLLKSIGERMKYSSRKLLLYRTVNCIIFSFLVVLNFVNYFLIDFKMSVKNAESSVIVTHILMKYLAFICYKPDIENILCYQRKAFWLHQDFAENIAIPCNDLFRKIKVFQVVVVAGTYTAVLLWVSRPFFSNTLPLEMWMIKEGSGFSALVVLLQYYIFAIIVPIVLGYDLLYASFCVEVIVQLRLLKSKLKYFGTNKVSDGSNELQKCVKHHQLLLDIFKQMRDIYSIMFLFHYFFTLVASCVELYELILGHLKVSRIFGNLMNIAMLLNQFAYYSFPAEFVASEFADVTNAIYMSRWYNWSNRMQKQLCFMMHKSQCLTYFSAAGIININVENFGGLIRKILSFYAILRKLLDT